MAVWWSLLDTKLYGSAGIVFWWRYGSAHAGMVVLVGLCACKGMVAADSAEV